jgi:hypothetical protein
VQDASAEFETAIEKGQVTWCQPEMLVDWLDDGAVALGEDPPAYVIEQFNNRESSSTWLRPEVGRPTYLHLGGSDADYDIPGGAGYGRIRFNATNTSRAALIASTTAVGHIQMSFVASAALTGAGEVKVSVVLAGDGTGQYQYMATFEINLADATIDLNIIERFGGVDASLGGSDDALTYVHGHTYTVVAQLDTVSDGEFLRAKFWDASISREPAGWTLEDNLNGLFDEAGTYGGVEISVPAGITTTTPFYFHITEFRLIDGSIDDLSPLIGQVVIAQDMDDGLPGQVSYVQEQGSVALDAQLLAGRRGLRAVQYLSQYNPLSPLYGLPRDVAPITFEHGVVTSAGEERVRLFTGQMVDVALGRDQIGHLTAMSTTRLKLSTLVQPPPFNRYGDMSATWLVSWAAYQCAVYAAPPPSSGGVWYAPLHGSLQPFMDSGMPSQSYYPVVFPILFAGYYRDDGSGELETVTYGDDPESTPTYIDGPYVAAPDLQYTSDLAWGIYYDFPAVIDAADGSIGYLLSQDGPRGRFEFAVRGDDFDTTGPSGADFTPTTFVLLFAQENQSGNGTVHCGINMSRELRIELSDGTASINVSAGSDFDLPTDGEWYRYGIAWDFVAETVYFFKQDPDGTEYTDSSTNSALDVTRLPTGDEPFIEIQPFNTDILEGFLNPYIHSFLPCAELHLVAGLKANPNTMPWIWQNDFNPGAIIRRSATRLRAIAEPSEREAWELIGAYAQAELAAVRVDENDRLLYLTHSAWVEGQFEVGHSMGQAPASEEDEGTPVTVATTYVFSTDGQVVAIRFWGPTPNTGTYTVELWQVDTDDSPAGSGTGTLLASATRAAADVTAGTWNAVPITPQAVTTGVAYKAAVHCTSGRFVRTASVFDGAEIVSGRITAIESGSDPVGIGALDNGTYVDGAAGTYPNDSFEDSDYFVDLRFQPSTPILSTLTNVAELVPQTDPSRIRNMIRVDYKEARFDSLFGPVYQSREVIAIPPGESTLIIPLDVLTTDTDTALATLPTSAEIDAGVSNFISGGWHTFFTINTQADGSGTYLSGPSSPSTDLVVMQVDSVFTAGLVTVSVTNRTGSTVYTANNNPEVPTINIGGIGMHLTDASVTTTRESSIALRGNRGLTVDMPVHQRREDAQRLAQRLLNELAEPSPTIEGVRVFGDPRRQPGDLVTFEDAHQTAISGLWRVLSVKHVVDGANYYQDLRLRKALTVGQWQTSGESRWGETLWGREGY